MQVIIFDWNLARYSRATLQSEKKLEGLSAPKCIMAKHNVKNALQNLAVSGNTPALIDAATPAFSGRHFLKGLPSEYVQSARVTTVMQAATEYAGFPSATGG